MATNPRSVFPGAKPVYSCAPPLAHQHFASNLTTNLTPTKPGQPTAFHLEPLDRRLPSNLEAERAVLGAVLLDNACLASLTTAAPEHFFLHQHQIIARTMKAMGDENIPIDLVTLMEALERVAQLEVAGV